MLCDFGIGLVLEEYEEIGVIELGSELVGPGQPVLAIENTR